MAYSFFLLKLISYNFMDPKNTQLNNIPYKN